MVMDETGKAQLIAEVYMSNLETDFLAELEQQMNRRKFLGKPERKNYGLSP